MLRKFVIIFILLFFSVYICGCDNSKNYAKLTIALLNACQEKTNTGDNCDSESTEYKNSLEHRQQQFTQAYSNANGLYNNKISSDCKTIADVQVTIANDSKAADTYKEIDGYSNVCGIMSANNGIIINGNVAVYGGFYTQGKIQMANGALAVIDNSYIDKIATYPTIYNGEVFLSDILKEDDFEDIIKSKPVDIQHVKRRIKLINISEVSNED